MKKTEELIKEYESLTKDFPEDTQLSLQLAEIYYKNNKKDLCLKILSTLQKRYPKDIIIQSTIIDLYLRFGADKKLIEQGYMRLRQLEPDETSHVISLAEYYFAENQKDQALQTARELFTMHGEKSEKHFMFAELMANHDIFDEAEKNYKLAIGAAPDNLSFQMSFAVFLNKRGNSRGAIEILLKILETGDGESGIQKEAKLKLLEVFRRNNLLKKNLLDVLKIFSAKQSIQTGLLLVDGFVEIRDFARVSEIFQMLNKSYPENFLVAEKQEEFCILSGNLDCAIEVAMKFSAHDKTYLKDGASRAADYFLKKNEAQKAITLLEESVKLFPEVIQNYLKLIELKIATGNTAHAAEFVHSAFKISEKTEKESLLLARMALILSENDIAEKILLDLADNSSSGSIRTEAWRLLLADRITGGDILKNRLSDLKKSAHKSPEGKNFLEIIKTLVNLNEIQPQNNSMDILKDDIELSISDIDASRKQAVIDLMGRAGSISTVYQLSEILKEDDHELKIRAAYAIGLIGKTELYLPFTRMLKASEKQVREIGVWLLGFSASDEARNTLNSILRSSEGSRMKALACLALAHAGYENDDHEEIILALRNTDKTVRIAAAWALGFLKEEKSVAELKNAMQMANSADEYGMMIWALLRTGGDEVRKELYKNLWSDSGSALALLDAIISIMKIAKKQKDEIINFEKEYYLKILDPSDGSLEIKRFPLPPLMNKQITNQAEFLKEFLFEEKDVLCEIMADMLENGSDAEKTSIIKDIRGETGYFGGPFSRFSLLTTGKAEMTGIALEYYSVLKTSIEKALKHK
jgi:predicted Zn-dependent protease